MEVDQTQIDKIISMAKSYGARRLILFGSILKADKKAKDIDLACDGVQGWKLFELASRLEQELKTNLDIVPLKPPTRFTRLIETRGKVLL